MVVAVAPEGDLAPRSTVPSTMLVMLGSIPGLRRLLLFFL